MKQFSPQQIKIISYALSQLCTNLESQRIDHTTRLRTEAHSWLHKRGWIPVIPVEFTPTDALDAIAQCGKLLKEAEHETPEN